jgi:DNA-binding response OmpR family regulator
MQPINYKAGNEGIPLMEAQAMIRLKSLSLRKARAGLKASGRRKMEPANILVIDDDPMVRESMKLALEDEEHRVTTATDGMDALAKLDAEVYDLVFTDYFMPELKGDELARKIKKRHPSTIIVMLTSLAPPGLDRAVDLVMVKPCSMAALRASVDNFLKKA